MPGLTTPMSGFPRAFRKIFWSFRRRLTPNLAVELPFDVDLKIKVRLRDRLGRRILLNGYSEPDYALFLEHFLKPGMTYLDVGAHFGQYVLMAAKRVGSTGAVHAFEPTGETFAQLKANLEINGFGWVVANHAAVSDRAGTLELKVCVSGEGEFNSVGRPMRPEKDVVRTESVAAVCLDDYCRDHGLGKIDLIKIDVEGAELWVTRGAAQVFAREQAPTLVCEFNERTAQGIGSSCRELRQALEATGYRLFRFQPSSRRIEPEPPGTEYDHSRNLIATKEPEAVQALLAR